MLVPYLRRLYICSEIEGSLIVNEKPLQNAEITRVSRSFYFDREPITDITTTDENGRFKFEKRTITPLVTLLHEPVIDQQISVRYKQEVLKNIRIHKGNYTKNGEMKRLIHDYSLKFDREIKLEISNGKLQLHINLLRTERKLFG